jgi:hypothetical protein
MSVNVTTGRQHDQREIADVSGTSKRQFRNFKHARADAPACRMSSSDSLKPANSVVVESFACPSSWLIPSTGIPLSRQWVLKQWRATEDDISWCPILARLRSASRCVPRCEHSRPCSPTFDRNFAVDSPRLFTEGSFLAEPADDCVCRSEQGGMRCRSSGLELRRFGES